MDAGERMVPVMDFKINDENDFESRFVFSTNLPPPIKMGNLKRRKSFSGKLFKLNGTTFRLPGKGTLKLRQKSKEKSTSLNDLYFDDIDNTSSKKIVKEERVSVSSAKPVTIPPSLIVSFADPSPHSDSSGTVSYVEPYTETPPYNVPSKLEYTPIVLSKSAESYIPNSTDSSVITLQTKSLKSIPVKNINESGKFNTFKKNCFALENISEMPVYSSINKGKMNRSNFDSLTIYSMNSSNESNNSVFSSTKDNSNLLGYESSPSLSTSSLESILNSQKTPLACSSPKPSEKSLIIHQSKPHFYNQDPKTRTNFSCRPISHITQTNEPIYENIHKSQNEINKVLKFGDIKNKRHQSLCDIPTKVNSCNPTISNIANGNSNSNKENSEQISSQNAKTDNDKIEINSNQIKYVKPPVPSKPNNLKLVEKTKLPPSPVKFINGQREMNNNTLVMCKKPLIMSKAKVTSLSRQENNFDRKSSQTSLKAEDSLVKSEYSDDNIELIKSENKLTKVREMVKTFNKGLKYRCTSPSRIFSPKSFDKKLGLEQKFNVYSSTLNLTNKSEKRSPNGINCGSVSDFINKRSIIEDKLPHMLNLVGNGYPSLKTKI